MNHVEEILNRAKEIHLKKRADYTTKPDENPYENFARANEIVSWFPIQYRSFASHIGTKLARLGSLLSTNRTPNNESLDDTFLDLVTYCALAYGYYKSSQYPGNLGPIPDGVFVDGNGDEVANAYVRPLTPQEKEYAPSRPIKIEGGTLTPGEQAYVEETIRGLNPVSTRCNHTHLNLNRKCGICGKTISWGIINGSYLLDQFRDVYILKK